MTALTDTLTLGYLGFLDRVMGTVQSCCFFVGELCLQPAKFGELALLIWHGVVKLFEY